MFTATLWALAFLSEKEKQLEALPQSTKAKGHHNAGQYFCSSSWTFRKERQKQKVPGHGELNFESRTLWWTFRFTSFQFQFTCEVVPLQESANRRTKRLPGSDVVSRLLGHANDCGDLNGFHLRRVPYQLLIRGPNLGEWLSKLFMCLRGPMNSQ